MLYASDHSDLEDGHMHLPGQSKFGFKYKSMHQRIQAAKAYVYDEFLEDYDFFHFCGDDVYLMVENMKEVLASKKVREWDETPGKVSILGFWTNWGSYPQEGDGKFYLNGAPGYTFSRKALKAYVEGTLETCQAHDTPAEDIAQSRCLWSKNYTDHNAFIDTRDEEGAHRYHAQDIYFHSEWRNTRNKKITTLYSRKVIPQSLQYLQDEFGFPFVSQDTYISKSSIAFHATAAHKMRRMEILLYKKVDEECDATTSSSSS